jgi:hypothetical protein
LRNAVLLLAGGGWRFGSTTGQYCSIQSGSNRLGGVLTWEGVGGVQDYTGYTLRVKLLPYDGGGLDESFRLTPDPDLALAVDLLQLHLT